MKTGDIEVLVQSLQILNVASRNLPIFIREFNKAKESQQMKYRYLSLRYPELQRNLRIRSRLIMKMREYLINECGFVDIETPTLFKSTPGVLSFFKLYNLLLIFHEFSFFYHTEMIYIVGCARIYSTYETTGKFLLASTESSTIQTAPHGGWL